MRKWILIFAILFAAVQATAQEQEALKTQEEKLSYGMGVEIGQNFKQNGVKVDVDLLVKGLRDALSGLKLLMDQDELQATLTRFRQELIKKRGLDKRAAAIENKKDGDAFLAGNKTREGVVTLQSGLQYKVLKEGDGKKPTLEDTVECNYRGTLLDGTEFDGTYGTGKPVTFPLKSLIPGVRNALILMPVGSKWQVFVPPELGYGERGTGRYIGPNATLIFEMELISIK